MNLADIKKMVYCCCGGIIYPGIAITALLMFQSCAEDCASIDGCERMRPKFEVVYGDSMQDISGWYSNRFSVYFFMEIDSADSKGIRGAQLSDCVSCNDYWELIEITSSTEFQTKDGRLVSAGENLLLEIPCTSSSCTVSEYVKFSESSFRLRLKMKYSLDSTVSSYDSVGVDLQSSP